MLREIPSNGKKITEAQLARHNCDEIGMWVAVHGRVFDLSEFYMEHPGGYEIIEEYSGQDCT